jgi:ribosome-binding factor A|nr:ribosome-binding factor [Phenylobacterium sp.]
MKRPPTPVRAAPRGPSQRQLRAGELVRHALVEILRAQEITDPDLAGVSVTLTEVRMSPDLRNATVFVEPLGGGEQAAVVVKALNRHHKFLRGRLGHAIDMKFTPALKFLHDETFDAAARMNRLFADPRVAQDLTPHEPPPSPDGRGILDDKEEPSPRLGGSWKDQD